MYFVYILTVRQPQATWISTKLADVIILIGQMLHWGLRKERWRQCQKIWVYSIGIHDEDCWSETKQCFVI